MQVQDKKTKTAQVGYSDKVFVPSTVTWLPQAVKAGETVSSLKPTAGLDVKDGDEKYIIVGEANILAIIE